MNTPFWSNDPQILWNTKYLVDIWPSNKMNLESQLNALSRLIIYLSIFGFLISLIKILFDNKLSET